MTATGTRQRAYEAAYRERKRLGIRSTYSNALTPEERLLGQVVCNVATHCWDWTGGRNAEGYGITTLASRRHSAHHATWLLLRGPIPAGLEPDHLCRVRLCVNPDHLELVTHLENCRRGLVGAYLRDRDRCKNGHPYDATNTRRDARGVRVCRACCRARTAIYRAQRQLEVAA